MGKAVDAASNFDIYPAVAGVGKEVLDVILDGQATGAFGVVPGEIDAGKSVSGPVLGNFIMLNKEGYYQCPATPGLWRHKWRPILFCLIVDNFGIKYVDKRHADQLCDILLEHYGITQDWSGY